MFRFEWDTTPEQMMAEGYDAYVAAIRDAVRQLAQRFAPQIETWMKANAVWTDRTGNARQTLYTEVEQQMTTVGILLSHGVDYGVYLELANQGEYSVIGPALDYWAPRIWNAVQALFR